MCFFFLRFIGRVLFELFLIYLYKHSFSDHADLGTRYLFFNRVDHLIC